MVISDRNTPFERTSESSEGSYGNWHSDRSTYTEQQIGEMQTWIKTMKELSLNGQTENCEAVDTNTFSDMQRLVYDIVNAHQQDDSNDKEP